jgi:hypothetical protein
MARLPKLLPAHREVRFAVILIGVGLLVMPLIIYAVGAFTLGAADTGLWAYLKSLYGSLLQLRPSAWILILGPYLLVLLLRTTSRPIRRRSH